MIWLMQAHLFSDHFVLQKEGHTKLENYGYVKKTIETCKVVTLCYKNKY